MALRLSTRLKCFNFSKNYHLTPSNRFCNKEVTNKKRLEDYFFDNQVQTILKKITGFDLKKIFRPRKQSLTPYKYEFVTEKQLKELQEAAVKKAVEKLQMPPVMQIREPIEGVLAKDPELQGYLRHKLVFIDLSSSKHSRNRAIVVRETDGTLRKATWEERTNMNQIFFPIEGRSLESPKLYESPYLDKLLDDGSYIFVLDSACCQYEPDDPEYYRVTHLTYEHIRSNKQFDVLRSTRHFGPMVFYFAHTKNIDSLLVEMIEKQLLSDAADTIRLLYILHPELKTKNENLNDINFIEDYIKSNSCTDKSDLERSMQSFIEMQTMLEKEESSM